MSVSWTRNTQKSQSEMRLVGAQIAQMKDRDFESMVQYIQVRHPGV